MKKFLKWTLLVVARRRRRAAFRAFLYFIPPFFITPPGDVLQGRWPTRRRRSTDIADPAERAIAERGRDIVMTHRLHRLPRDQRPAGARPTKYLAGGGLKVQTRARHVRQPQPDAGPRNRPRPGAPTTRSSASCGAACSPTATSCRYTTMPWASFSNWTEEDRHAVVVYLRHLPPIRHEIPEPDPATPSRCRARSSRTTAAKTTARRPAQTPVTALSSARRPKSTWPTHRLAAAGRRRRGPRCSSRVLVAAALRRRHRALVLRRRALVRLARLRATSSGRRSTCRRGLHASSRAHLPRPLRRVPRAEARAARRARAAARFSINGQPIGCRSNRSCG